MLDRMIALLCFLLATLMIAAEKRRQLKRGYDLIPRRARVK